MAEEVILPPPTIVMSLSCRPPLAPLIRNEETIAIMKAARKGKLIEVDSVKNLIDSLNAGDKVGVDRLVVESDF